MAEQGHGNADNGLLGKYHVLGKRFAMQIASEAENKTARPRSTLGSTANHSDAADYEDLVTAAIDYLRAWHQHPMYIVKQHRIVQLQHLHQETLHHPNALKTAFSLHNLCPSSTDAHPAKVLR